MGHISNIILFLHSAVPGGFYLIGDEVSYKTENAMQTANLLHGILYSYKRTFTRVSLSYQVFSNVILKSTA